MSAIPKSSLSFYEQLVRTQHKTLLRLAVTLLSRKNKTPDIYRAEDAVQETFSIAWEKWDVLSTHPNPAGWLVITLKNVVKNMLREEQHWAEHLLQLPADITQPSPGADLELEGIVPPEDFLLLKRLYLYGETYEEVCQDLGIKKSALAMRVKRIKEQFRKNYMEIEKNFSSNSEQTAPTRHNTNRGGSKEMKYPTENSKKYPGLEQLSTPELEELLRQDLVTSEDDDASMALITEIMEVIDARETQIPSPIDADTAWQTFLARNVTHTTAFGSPDTSLQEVTETPSSNVVSFPSTEPPKRRKKLRWFISFAAVLCLLTCFLTISATGKEVTKFLVEWSNHTFSFMPDELSVSRLDSADYDQMKSKVATLTDLPVLPTRYPAGADLMQIEDNPAFMSEGVTFVFSSPRGGFSISVNVFHSASENSSGQYEKNPGPLEEYYVGGIPHYIAKNIDTYTAVWRNENLECSIQGDLSIDQLKAMIDSIYNNYGE